MQSQLRFTPGWDTPILVRYDKPSFLSWLLKFKGERKHCAARRQGNCPGLDHCHDCQWSNEEER